MDAHNISISSIYYVALIILIMITIFIISAPCGSNKEVYLNHMIRKYIIGKGGLELFLTNNELYI